MASFATKTDTSHRSSALVEFRTTDVAGNTYYVETGTYWDGKIVVQPAGDGSNEEALAAPCAEPLVALCGDCCGFVYAASAVSLHRLNPRAEGLRGATDPYEWQEVGPLPAGRIIAASASRTHDALLELRTTLGTYSMADQRTVLLDIDADGAATVVDAPEEGNRDWEILRERLPCGNHDISVVEARCSLYTAGGLTHFHGFPATAKVFDGLWTYRPLGDDSGWFSAAGWQRLATLPRPVCYAGLAALDTCIYVVGGAAPHAGDHGDRRPVASVARYDLDAYAWAEDPAPDLPEPRMECCAVGLRGRLWVLGGANCDNAALDSALSWAPGEPSWRREPPAPAPLRQFAVAADGDVIYCVGGDAGFFYGFDVAAGAWDASLPPHPTRPKAPLAAVRDGELWVLGGARQSAVHAFDGRSWRREECDLPAPRAWGGAAALQGRLVCVGGAFFDERVGGPAFDDRVFATRSPADKAKYAGQRAVEAEWIKSRRQRLEREARERAADDAEYEKALLTTPATPLHTPRRPAPGTPVLTPATTPRLRRLDTPGADGDDEGGVDWGDDDDVSSDAASTIDADEVYCAPCAPKD